MPPREQVAWTRKGTKVLERPKLARSSRRVNDMRVLADTRWPPLGYFGGVVPVADVVVMPVISCCGLRLPISMLMRHSGPTRVSTSA